MPDALKKADEVLQQAVQGITDLINVPAIINLDFADVETVMKDKGIAHIGIGVGQGEEKAADAVKMAVESPLLETKVDGATNVLINISGDITLVDANDASSYVQNLAGDDVNIIFGVMYDESQVDTCTVTVIATGISDKGVKSSLPKKEAKPVSAAEAFSAADAANAAAKEGKGAGFAPGAKPGGGAATPQAAAEAGEGAAAEKPSVKPIGSFAKQAEVSGKVPQKSLKIPEFLQKK